MKANVSTKWYSYALLFILTLSTSALLAKDVSTEPSATSRYRLEKKGAVHTLISPAGQPYWTLGVNHIGKTTGRRGVAKNLRDWGFNSAGHGVHGTILKEMPYLASAPLTRCMHYLQADKFRYDDIFTKEFEGKVKHIVKRTCKEHKENPNLIGYYWTDTPRWDLDIARQRRGTDWVSTIRQLPADAAGKQAYIQFLKERFENSIGAFNLAFRMEVKSFDALLSWDFAYLQLLKPEIREADEAFLGVIAEHLYKLTYDAFQRHDSEALLFGERYKGYDHPPAVLAAAVKYVDVISIQPGPEKGPMFGAGKHESVFDSDYFAQLHKDTGKPILICDHAISWHTKQRPLTLWHQFPSFQEAIACYDAYLTSAAATPYIIGYNRCQYRSRYWSTRKMLKQGLLQENGEPYQKIVEGFSATNRKVLQRRKTLWE